MKREAPDIFCIQETKCQEDDVPKVHVEIITPNLPFSFVFLQQEDNSEGSVKTELK